MSRINGTAVVLGNRRRPETGPQPQDEVMSRDSRGSRARLVDGQGKQRQAEPVEVKFKRVWS